MSRSTKSRKKNSKSRSNQSERELRYKLEGEEYAHVTKVLGSGRVTADCADGETRHCIIRGNNS